MITINILFFGGLKNFFPQTTSIEMVANCTIQSVIEKLAQLQPNAQTLLSSCAVAINNSIVDKQTNLEHSIQVALLPPFSGG